MRALRPISISSVAVSEGIEIRQGCRFISSLVRALGQFPVEWVGPYLARLVGICPNYVILDGISALVA